MALPVPLVDDLCVKDLAKSQNLKSIPCGFTFVHDSKSSSSGSIPTVDFSLLVSDDADRRSKALLDLGKGCEEWGFFVVYVLKWHSHAGLINHGIPETLMKAVIDVSLEFFDLPEEEKRRYEAKSVSDPISAGTGIGNSSNHKMHIWRDFLKSYLHPQFYCPEKPQRMRTIMSEYSEKVRWVLRELLQGVSENLKLEPESMNEALNLDSCSQLYAANLYPPHPQPDLAIGIPPHTDYGLLTFLIHNGVPGLQIQRNEEWFHTSSPQNAVLINVADQLEIFSNGRYKSLKHRAVLNTEATRISVVMANGPAPDATVSPSAELVRRDGRAFYAPMKYVEFIETKLTNRHGEKGIMEHLKINQQHLE